MPQAEDIHVHVHIHNHSDEAPEPGESNVIQQLFDSLQRIEAIVSDINVNVAALQERLNADWTNLQQQVGVLNQALSDKDALLAQMAELDVTQVAEIADLKAKNDAINSQVSTAQGTIDSIDLDSAFPPASG